MLRTEWTSDYWLQSDVSLPMDQWPTFILIKPQLPTRGIVVSRLLRAAQNPFVYAVKPTEQSLNSFLSSLITALSDRFPGQVLSLAGALAYVSSTPSQWADALADDLARLNIQCLALDDFDCLQDDAAVGEFFTRLGTCLGDMQKVVINTRTLPLARWVQAVHEGRAVVIGDETTANGPVYSDVRTSNQRHVEVSSLAGGFVRGDGVPIYDWDGPLPRNLFYYLIDHFEGVSREEIFATFWPKLSRKEATNVFHVSKGKIAEHIGTELTEYRRNYYFPSPQVKLHYDVAYFEEMVRQARMASTQDAAECWSEAVRVYRQEFLSPYDLAWIKSRRDELRTLYAEALICLGQHHQSQSNAQAAIAFFMRALREAPDREDVHRALIELYAEIGRIDKAIVQYESLAERLKRVWGVKPSPATRTLYEQISGKSNS